MKIDKTKWSGYKTPMQLSNALEITPYVFVYGTLKKGESNNGVLHDSPYVGPSVTLEKYILGDVGFPYMFDVSGEDISTEGEELRKNVVGDVFEIYDVNVLQGLDFLEGEGRHYTRKVIEVRDGFKCWAYFNTVFSDISKCYVCDVTEENNWVWRP